MLITFYQRKPTEMNFSIERAFGEVRRSLPTDFTSKVVVSSFKSKGI